MELLIFVADNLAFFPYMAQDEPLFVMHHIEIAVSVTGANLLQSFKEVGVMEYLRVKTGLLARGKEIPFLYWWKNRQN